MGWVAALFGTAYWRGQNETVRRSNIQRDLPAQDRIPVPDAGTPAVGRVVLDLAVGEFHVSRGDPGEPIRIDAEFDTRSYRLTETFEPSQEGAWIYRVRFEETSWFKDGGLRSLLGGSFPEVRIWLPPDVPLVLVGRFGKGFAGLDLGGLWLTEIDVTLEKGGIEFDIDEPLVAPADRVSLNLRQGGGEIRGVANASPRQLVIAQRMGGGEIDLRGAWVRDAEIRIDTLMGGGALRLPRDVRIVGLPGGPREAAASDLELRPPTLSLFVSTTFGNLEVMD